MRAALLCVALCASMAIAADRAASQPPSPRSGIGVQQQGAVASQSAQQRASEPIGTERAPLFVKSIPSPDSEADTAHKKYEHHEKPTLDRWLTWSTVALAAFTLALFVFTALLWRSTSKLVRDANENAQRQLRAYINVREATAKWKMDSAIAQHRAWIAVKVTNSGQTPARKVTGWVAHKSVDAGADPTPFGQPKGAPESVSVFGPGQSSWFAYAPMVVLGEDEEVIAWSTGRKRLYVWGRMDYEDVFGRPRWTTFRLEMPHEACGKKRGRFRPCAEGNDCE